MADRGGQIGNSNAAKGRLWRSAIERALAKRSRGDMVAALDDLAEKFLVAVEKGDIAAFRELGDRMDGKAIQGVIVGGDSDNPLVHAHTHRVSEQTDGLLALLSSGAGSGGTAPPVQD